MPLPLPHRIGHSEPVKRLAPLLLLVPCLMLAGRAYAAPEPGLYDALGRPIALPGVSVPGSITLTTPVASPHGGHLDPGAANAYDANGNRMGRDKPGGDVDEEAEYDAQDRLVDYAGIAHTFGDPGELQAARDAWGFDQDAMGHLLQASKPAYLSSSPRGGHVFGAW